MTIENKYPPKMEQLLAAVERYARARLANDAHLPAGRAQALVDAATRAALTSAEDDARQALIVAQQAAA